MQMCVAQQSLRGLFIKTLSGDGTKAICTIKDQTTIKHIVTITNLALYPLRVVCKGSILGNPSPIRFVSPNPSDTENEWTGIASPHPGLEYTFDHVSLRSVFPGTCIIAVEIKADWYMRGRIESALLKIHVTTV